MNQEERIRGSIYGAVLGDAMGGAYEFYPVSKLIDDTGSRWLGELHPYDKSTGAHHAWGDPPPIGTGTDDFRYHYLFWMGCLNKNGILNPVELAKLYLEVFQNPQKFFPGWESSTKDQWSSLQPPSLGILGKQWDKLPELSPSELVNRGIGLNFPILLGMIALPTVGLFYPGDPLIAYKKAYELAFFDTGYAK